MAVVLNWCGLEVSRACLDSILLSDYSPLEILLVDNASSDGSGQILQHEYPEIPYLQTGKNLGYAGGNNRGIEWALHRGAEYVLIINNDTVVDPSTVTKLVQALESDSAAGAISPKILFHDRPDLISFGGGQLSRLRAIGHHTNEGRLDRTDPMKDVAAVSFLSGCCLLVPARVLRTVGGFDEDFFAYVEDVDLSLRMADAGYTLLYHPEARILHHSKPTDAQPSPFQIFLRDRNRRRLARRRYDLKSRLLFWVFFYPTRFLHLLSYAVRGDSARARAIWRGMTST